VVISEGLSVFTGSKVERGVRGHAPPGKMNVQDLRNVILGILADLLHG